MLKYVMSTFRLEITTIQQGGSRVYQDRSVVGDSVNMYDVSIERDDGQREHDRSHHDMYVATLEALALADSLGRSESGAKCVVIHHRGELMLSIAVIVGGLAPPSLR